MISLPLMGLGTFIGVEADRVEDSSLRQELVRNTVYSALAIGYRHIDLAVSYGNLEAVGQAIQRALENRPEGLGLKRSDLWLTMKSDGMDQAHINQLLSRMGLGYFDVFLIHHPMYTTIFGGEKSLTEGWGSLCNLDGIQHVGVSNACAPHLERLLAVCEKNKLPKPYANEIESNPWSPNTDLIEYCNKRGIQPIAYSPLGYHVVSWLLADETLNKLAEELNATAAQVALAWQIKRGVAVIPKSINEHRLMENYQALALADVLSEQQCQQIEKIAPLIPATNETNQDALAHAAQLDWTVDLEKNRAESLISVRTLEQGVFFQAMVQDKPSKSDEGLIKDLKQYVSTRAHENYQYNVLLSCVVDFVTVYFFDFFSYKSGRVKMAAARNLLTELDGNDVVFQPQELDALDDGRLGEILKRHDYQPKGIALTC